MVGSVGDRLYSNRGFSVDILIMTGNNSKYDGGKLISSYVNKSGVKNITFNTCHKKMIIFSYRVYDREERKSFVKKFVVPFKLFEELKLAVDVTVGWLTSTKYADLFVRNDGVLTRLGNVPSKLPTVVRTRSEFLLFKPSIVIDDSGSKMEGVSILLSGEPLASLACGDYLTMVNGLRSFLNNSYTSTLQLISTAMLFSKN